MTASERIWLTTREAHGKDLPPEKWADPNTTQLITTYILATPAALAASPEVQALVEAAVTAEREQSRLLEALRQAVAAGPLPGDDMRRWIERQMRSAAAVDAAAAIRALSAVKREAGE